MSARLTFLQTPHNLIGASLLRVVTGVTILYEYLHVYAQRSYLYGPQGVLPLESVRWSLYTLSSDWRYFEALFHLSVLTVFAWTLGFRTRVLTPLVFAAWFSLQKRNEGLMDGGHNLMQILLIYACFANVGAYFAWTPSRSGSTRTMIAAISAVTHNAAMLAIALQVCVVYAVAGLSKAFGETWRNGTALYYAFRSSEFYLPGAAELLWSNDILLTILSYATVFFQIGFPFFLFLNEHSRRLAVVVGIGFHLGVATVMGLVTFGLFMIAADLALIPDEDYRRLAEGAKAWVRRLRVNRWHRTQNNTGGLNET